MFQPCYASSAWHSRRAEIGLKVLCSPPFTAEAGVNDPFKRRLHCPGDMAVRMRKVLARPWVVVSPQGEWVVRETLCSQFLDQ